MWNYYTYLGHPNICPKNALFRLLHMVYFLHYWDVPTFAWKMHSSGVRTSWIFYIVGTSQHLLEKCTLQACTHAVLFTLLGHPIICLNNALFRHAHMVYFLHCWDVPTVSWKNALFRRAHKLYFLRCWDVPIFAWKMHSFSFCTHKSFFWHSWDVPTFASNLHNWIPRVIMKLFSLIQIYWNFRSGCKLVQSSEKNQL